MLGHAQMALDDAAADRLDIDDAGEAVEVCGRAIRRDRPRAPASAWRERSNSRTCRARGDAGGMAAPADPAIRQGDIGADMRAAQQLHPHMAGLQRFLVFRRAGDHAAAGAHATHVVDRLGEDGKARRHRAVRPVRQPLAVADGQLVVDRAMADMAAPTPSHRRSARRHRPGNVARRNTASARNQRREMASRPSSSKLRVVSFSGYHLEEVSP